MTDVFSLEKRAAIMSAIRAADTKPEVFVRRLLFQDGFRFRLHQRALPGCPDIVLKRWRTVVFVNGCFWHQHAGCARAAIPSTKQDYWLPKLARNQERDKAEHQALLALGWRVLVVWECACRKSSAAALSASMAAFIRAGGGPHAPAYAEIGRASLEPPAHR